jgi:hypothetical protein
MKPVQSSSNWQWGVGQGAINPTSASPESVEDVKSATTPDDVKVQVPSAQRNSQIAEARLQGDTVAAELHKMVDLNSPPCGIVTDNKDPDKMEASILDVENAIALSPQGPGTMGLQTHLRGNASDARDNEDNSSNVGFGWDLKQSGKD